MRSAPRGDDTSQAEIIGISPRGIWIALGDREAFLPFKRFPWFREAPVAGILHVERPQPHHLYWPDLDIDLSVESILHPERFPLISRERPTGRSTPPARPPRSRSKVRPRRSRAR